MATPLASAFVRIRPETSGFQKDAEKEFDKAGGNAGKAFETSFSDTVGRGKGSDKAGNTAGKKFGSAFADSLKVAVGVSIAAVGEKAAEGISSGLAAAMDLSAARGQLQAQLGLTQAESGRIGGVAGKLFAQAYGENMQEVQGAVTSVIQNMDGMRTASSAALQETTARAITTGQVIGSDVGEVTNAVSQLMRTGLAKDSKTAFDIITKGAQTGANKAGDLLDTFNEYSTQFRRIGLDGTTALALIQQGLQAGARDSDQVADAIGQFGELALAGGPPVVEAFKSIGLNADDMAKRIGAGGPTAKAALGKTLAALRGTKDEQVKLNAATALFGDPGTVMGDALFALDPSGKAAAKSLGQVSGATDDAGKAMGDTAAGKLETFKRSMQTNVTEFIAGNVIPAMEKMGSALSGTGISGTAVASAAVGIGALGFAAKGAASAVSGIATAGRGIGKVASGAAGAARGIGTISAGFRSAQVAESAFSGKAGTFGGKLRGAFDTASRGAKGAATAIANGTRAATAAALANGRLALSHARSGAAAALSATRTVLATAAQRAAAIATRGWAITQAALNLVMSMNPIGLVVIAIAALVAGIVIAYKNSQTFRNIVDAAFRGIAAAGKWMWAVVLKPIFDAIKLYIFKILIPYYKMLWNAVKAAFSGISSAVQFAWNNVIRPIWDALKFYITKFLIPYFKLLWSGVSAAFNGIRSVISTVWNNGIRPVFNAVKSAIGGVGTAFDRGASAIKSSWNRIKDATKAPVNFVIGTVYNKGIVGLWNKVMGWLHLPDSMKLGKIPMLESGGAMPVRPGVFNKPTAIVGEGRSQHPEYVIPTDPKYRGRAMSLWSAAGQKMQMLASGGILGFVKNAASKAIGLGKDALGLLTNPAGVWDRLVAGLPSAEGLRTSPFGNAAATIPKKIMGEARTYALSLFKSFNAGFGGGGDATGVVKAALKYIGTGDDRGMDNNNMFTRHFGWPAGTPWCALFISKALEDAKATKRYRGAPTAAVASFNAGMKHVPINQGRAGDLATYGSNDHVNLIIKKVAGGYDTVGGNQGPRVNRYVRGGQASVLRPMATGGVLSRQIRDVFGQRNLDRADASNPLLASYRKMKRPLFDDGGFGVGWPFHAQKKEAVFTDSQWQSVHALAARGASPTIGPIHITGLPELPSDKQIQNAIERTMIMHGRW